MTKFVLEGGHSAEHSEYDPALFVEMTREFDSPVRIAECLFSRPEGEQEKAFANRREFYAKYIHTPFEVRLAMKDNFLEVLAWANTMYFRGGTTNLLTSAMREFPEWHTMLDGKVIVGSSAGANMLSRYYNGLDEPGVRDGLGILPLKVMVHYRSNYVPGFDWEKAEQDMLNTAPELPLIRLRESEFHLWSPGGDQQKLV